MNVQSVLSYTVFSNGCEANYALRSTIDPSDYPQVHDFYEIVLITKGSLSVKINGNLLSLKKGNLLLIRPGDIHTKLECDLGEHINLAFPAYTIDALFRFLYDSPEKLVNLHSNSYTPICTLSNPDTLLMQSRISYLNLLPSDSIRRKNTYLRTILTDIISTHIMKNIEKQKKINHTTALPAWLDLALEKLSIPENLERGISYLVQETNRTPEHICRAFRQYLNTTPTNYINTKRLNYAANLLRHSDKEIIDIAYESGFQSVSHFYHLFKKEYQSSPLKYRNQYHTL